MLWINMIYREHLSFSCMLDILHFQFHEKKIKKLEQTLDKPNFLLNLGFESVNIQNKSYKIRETTRTYKLILREQWN